jgi:tetratricopeptide (TPR) repeat protein
MQYLELKSGDTTICVHNSWTGEETVEVNGQLVSKKSSILGTQHYFELVENGQKVQYTLITKLGSDGMSVKVDLLKDGKPIHSDVPLPYAAKPTSPALIAKQTGVKMLRMYDVDLAIKEFKKALKFAPNDPELYFHLACAYSNKENVDEGLKHLKISIEKGLKDHTAIFSHEMLAFLRIHPDFSELKELLPQEEDI